jgi:uncharacterized protein (TIGR02145 family)
MKIRNATIQIVKTKKYENADFAVLVCNNPDGCFPCNLDFWIKMSSSDASNASYDCFGMMSDTNLPRSLVGIEGYDDASEDVPSQPDYSFENLDSCVKFSLRVLGLAKTYFTVAVKCKKGTLAKAFFEARDIAFVEAIAGKEYCVSRINGLEWMTQNFDSERKGFYYGRTKENQSLGKLYPFAEAAELCPKGWHLPTEEEIWALASSVGGIAEAGKKLKSKIGWNHGLDGTDEFGFGAIPSGFYDPALLNNPYPDGVVGALLSDRFEPLTNDIEQILIKEPSVFAGFGSEFRMWLEGSKYLAIRQDNSMSVGSASRSMALSVRYVRDYRLIDTAPRFGGETFSCDSFKAVPYGEIVEDRDVAVGDMEFQDKTMEEVPLDEDPVFKYTYPVWNLEAGRYFNIMWRDDNDEFHLQPVPPEWQSLTQRQKYEYAVNWTLHSTSLPPGKMKFYYWIKDSSTQRKSGVDAAVAANWTEGLPVPVCDPFCSYEKRGSNAQGFETIDPFKGFNPDSVRKMITPFQGQWSDCVLVMEKYDSSLEKWSGFKMALYGRSWIFYDGIHYEAPEGATELHLTSPGDLKGDIIRPDTGEDAFLWFKGRSEFKRQMTQAAKKEGVIAVLDGDIEAVDYFMSDVNGLTVYEAKAMDGKFVWAYKKEGCLKGKQSEFGLIRCGQMVSDFNNALAAADSAASQDDYLNEILAIAESVRKQYECNLVELDEYGMNEFLDRKGLVSFSGVPSMLLEFVAGTTLKCSAIAIEGVIPNACNKLSLPQTDVEFMQPRAGAYGQGAADRAWDELISLSAKSLTFMTYPHTGYKLMSESTWEQGLPEKGRLEFRADAVVKKRGGGGELEAKAVDCKLAFLPSGEAEGSIGFKLLDLENASVTACKENWPRIKRLEARGECSLTIDMKDWKKPAHFADEIIVRKDSVLKIEIMAAETSLSDSGCMIALEGELKWRVPWQSFCSIIFNGESLANPAKLSDEFGRLRLSRHGEKEAWKNALVINALALIGTPPLLNSRVEYWEGYEDEEENYYMKFITKEPEEKEEADEEEELAEEETAEEATVPEPWWHFGVIDKKPGLWEHDKKEGLVEFRLQEETCWDIGKYYALTEGNHLGWFEGRSSEKQSLTVRLPGDESYFGKAAVYCIEDGIMEESPFILWNAVRKDLVELWNLDEMKTLRRGELILEHGWGIWIGGRKWRPEFELWFTPDLENVPMARLDLPITDIEPDKPRYDREQDDVLEAKNKYRTNIYTKLRLRLSLIKYPYDIPNGKIEVRFLLCNEWVVLEKSIRLVSTVRDSCLVRFHSHSPESRQLISSPGSVMVDIVNINSWNESVLDEVAEIVNPLEFEDGKSVKGLAEFVPFEVRDKHGKPMWYGDKWPIKNELGYTCGVRRKLKVIGAGSIKVRVNLRGAKTLHEDRGWLCDEQLRQNLGKKLDLVSWLPRHLLGSELVGLVKMFQDTLNCCFADNETNSPIGILEKIARLRDLKDIDRMEPRYFQYYADLFGVELTTGMALLEAFPEDERHMHARDVLRAYSAFQKEKTSMTALQTLLSMFGVFAEIRHLYSEKYSPDDESDWSMEQSSSNRRTQHFTLFLRVDDDEFLGFSPAFKQLIDDIKPATMVFKGWTGNFKVALEDGEPMTLTPGSTLKALNTMQSSEVQQLLWIDENLLEDQAVIDEREEVKKYISENIS